MSSLPQKLLFYYGWTSSATTTQTLTDNISAFNKFDIVVLSQSLAKPTHGDHANTKALINNPGMKNTKVFGYVSLAQNPATIAQEINEWQQMGDIYGIFCDEYGYDYKDHETNSINNNREHQNFMVHYIHRTTNSTTKEPFRAFVNAWNQDDVFAPEPNTGMPHILHKDDWTLLESYQINTGNYVSPQTWRQKMDVFNKYRGQTLVAATTTMNNKTPKFVQAQLDYAYASAILDNLDAFSWGEVNYLSTGTIPIRTLPTLTPDTTTTDQITVSNGIYKRRIDGVIVSINTSTHQVNFN